MWATCIRSSVRPIAPKPWLSRWEMARSRALRRRPKKRARRRTPGRRRCRALERARGSAWVRLVAMPPFRGPAAVDISLNVNGQGATAHLPPQRSLLEMLRGPLGLTGTKLVCNAGDCGACTVLVDDRPVYSCITLAVACEGKRVETIEGISKDGALHPVQEAFIDHDAYQCGFCTPGQVMSVVALLRANGKPTEDEMRRAVTGNLCRCGAYVNIVKAGMSAARRSK